MKRFLFTTVTVFFALLFLSMSSKDSNIVDNRIKDFSSRVDKDHPRVMIKKNQLDTFRKFFIEKSNDPSLAYIFKNAIVTEFNKSFYPEPERLVSKKVDSSSANAWRVAYENAFKNASTAQHYAFSYLLTGDKRYAREAIRWLLYIASWNVRDGIDILNNDEAFIQSLRPIIFAYDWVYEELTKIDKEKIENALNERLKILFDHIAKVYLVAEPIPFEKNDSHKMRFISTLGLGGLALFHEVKDAPTWLSWAYEYYNRQFPAWGGKDGGYSEGLNYWATGHNQHFMFLDAMKALDLRDFFVRDYFKNNGYFAIYNVLPFKFSSFGDLCNTLEPDENIAMHIEKYSLIYNDPYLKAFHEKIFKKYPDKISYYNYSLFDTIFHLFRKDESSIEKKELSLLPRSRAFYDVGWVSMHSELGSLDDIMLGFKSSPYGSYSHSFADQNSFVVNAFGEQLAISSGYREWYDSPHHVGWTRTTFSKNAVLFNKNGQRIKDANAKGRIVSFYTTDNFDWTTGDAKDAFDSYLGVIKNLRSVLFVNKAYFVIFDELENKNDFSHQWLLHSKESMLFDNKKGEVIVNRQNSEMKVKFLLPKIDDLKFSQTDQFTVPVDSAYEKRYKNEYHFTADAFKKSKNRDFIVLLSPYKKSAKKALEAESFTTKKGYILHSKDNGQDDTILLAKYQENQVETDTYILRGRATVVSKKNEYVNLFAVDSQFFKGNDFYFESDVPITFQCEIKDKKIDFDIKTDKRAVFKFKTEFKPKDIKGVSKENVSYDDLTKLLTITILESCKISLE